MEDAFERTVQAAKDAHDCEDWLGALELWKESVRLNPKFVSGYWMGGALSLMHGHLDEAEAMLSKGVLLEPTNISMAVEHAKAATLLKNWPEAIRRWNALSRRAPNNDDVIAGRAEAEMQIQMYRTEEASEDGLIDIDWKKFKSGRISSVDTDLFMHFESVGDNCEFGLVQRYFLAEPVSLLRWNRISLDGLIAGISNDFEGLGDPANTALLVGQNEEYALADHRYSMSMHTFLKKHLVSDDPDDLYRKMCQRQAYLGRKFIEDLSDPDQIFVYKSIYGNAIEDAIALHAALERHGPNYLLFAMEADENRPAGSVEEIAPRLFIGSIGHFARPGEGWDNLAFSDWRSVCHDVLRRVHKSQGVAGMFKRAVFKVRHWEFRAKAKLASMSSA